MQNLQRHWSNRLRFWAAAGMRPEENLYQVRPFQIKINELQASKDSATVTISLEVYGLSSQEVLPDFVNRELNMFRLRRINGRLKVCEFDTSTDPLAALDIPVDRLIDLWSDDYIQELLQKAKHIP